MMVFLGIKLTDLLEGSTMRVGMTRGTTGSKIGAEAASVEYCKEVRGWIAVISYGFEGLLSRFLRQWVQTRRLVDVSLLWENFLRRYWV